MKIGISVIMPTYNHAAFINKSIASLLNQTFKNWELIIINDGSEDNTQNYISHHLLDKRIKYYENETNIGLGASLNKGINKANYDYIAYLLSDDIFFEIHLQLLLDKLLKEPKSILVYSGIRYDYNYSVLKDSFSHSMGPLAKISLQLVQVLHKKNESKWIERDELVTDDLFLMYWGKLVDKGIFLPTDEITCEWTSHPKQRHKLISKSYNGGLHSYRQYYKVKEAIVFQSTSGEVVDERKYCHYLKRDNNAPVNGLKILLVGELSYNPERICAFEEHGHKLFGLWIKETSLFYSVGPHPFGNITNIAYESWEQIVEEIKPDIIYAQLNYLSVKLAHEVLMKKTDIPFVWHLKEGPFLTRSNGDWNKLFELYFLSDGQIYINQLVKDWFDQFMPPRKDKSFLLDGDLPKSIWFNDDKSMLISDSDGEPHTVLLGRPVGFSHQDIGRLADEKIHFHLYCPYPEIWEDWIKIAQERTSKYLHIHSNCTPENWVKELSRYDAGWLHIFESNNYKDILKVKWHDLNYPARISTLAAAGLPMIQYDNTNHLVATQTLTDDLGMGVFFKNFDELSIRLKDKEYMQQIRTNVWNNRHYFTFDYHMPSLIQFFKEIIESKHIKGPIQ